MTESTDESAEKTETQQNSATSGQAAPSRQAAQNGGKVAPQSPRVSLMHVPGVAAISLYLLVLAAVIVLGVMDGHHYPALFLVFSAAFVTASFGLMLLLRWAWSLALAAVFLLAAYNLILFSMHQQFPALVQGLLNLVFFLYLIRPEVRARLR
ncbi:MAG TPA: hypothetical protein VGR64_00065 [Terracidiphilus sp.]|nr:hypothetical protein [Terracidiphilus sp.]